MAKVTQVDKKEKVMWDQRVFEDNDVQKISEWLNSFDPANVIRVEFISLSHRASVLVIVSFLTASFFSNSPSQKEMNLEGEE